MKYKLFKVGYCHHPEFILKSGGRWGAVQIPVICALIQHPEKGNILFDTGYAPRFLGATQTFPDRFYRWVAPACCQGTDALVAQLACGGIDAADIDYVFISHFHADHIAGVADFPSARLIYGAEGMTYAQQMRGLRGVIKGILGDLVRGLQAMPSLPIEPIEPTHQGVPPDLAPFDQGYDLFGDGQLWAVPLPGHARGQYGLYFQASHGPVFLVADACWSSDAYQKGILPHPITRLAMDDWSSYCTTIQKLQVLWKRRPEILIIPSHCPKAWARYEGITRENFKTLPSWFSS